MAGERRPWFGSDHVRARGRIKREGDGWSRARNEPNGDYGHLVLVLSSTPPSLLDEVMEERHPTTATGPGRDAVGKEGDSERLGRPRSGWGPWTKGGGSNECAEMTHCEIRLSTVLVE